VAEIAGLAMTMATRFGCFASIGFTSRTLTHILLFNGLTPRHPTPDRPRDLQASASHGD
jgi:hypothetical protein